MASKSQTSTIVQPSYEDFEPYCRRQNEKEVETLIFHLPDFKKDQLRVQVNNLGDLKISGEKPSTEDENKRMRFLKETKIPKGCDMNDIRAKFSGGNLHVIMPKKDTSQIQQQQKPEDTQKPKEEALAPNADKLKVPSSEDCKEGICTSNDQPKKDHVFGLGNSLARLQVQKKVNVSLGVAIAALVAIGAYAAYKYGSSSSHPHIEE